MDIQNLPEVQALIGAESLIRIPNQIDVPVTDRVRRLIDCSAFQRLTGISQLGVVRFVYPGATHNRFEHSLGVYRNGLLFLQRFCSCDRFCATVSKQDAELLLLAALLHDVGHWPFAHPIEDMDLGGMPAHEAFAINYLSDPEIAGLLEQDWNVKPTQVIDIIQRKGDGPAERILGSILSGPIDIDKMDYLYRDSLHAGVPYGQNFDAPRLIKSLCLNATGDRLAITKKGKTAAELMVFARYVMFSEVYWHHAVRSATAMFQRAFFRWHETAVKADDFESTVKELFCLSEQNMILELIRQGDQTVVASLLSDLFGARRRLYKRIAAFGMDHQQELYSKIAQQPYQRLVQLGHATSVELQSMLGVPVDTDEVLIDAPPVGLEVQFNVDVYYPELDTYRKLGDVSPVVKTLAQRQFDDFVKQVRVFVSPRLKPLIASQDIDVSAMFAQLVIKVLD